MRVWELGYVCPLVAFVLPAVVGWLGLARCGLRPSERTALALPVGIGLLGGLAFALTLTPAVVALGGWALALAWAARGGPRQRPRRRLARVTAGTYLAFLGAAAGVSLISAFGFMHWDWFEYFDKARFLHANTTVAVPARFAHQVTRTPLFSLYPALLFHLFGPEFAVFQATSAASVAATPALAWVLARRLVGRRGAGLAAVGVLLCSGIWASAAQAQWSKPLAVVYALGALLLLYDARRAARHRPPPRARLALTGALIGLGALSHPSCLLLAPPVALELLTLPGPWRRRLTSLVAVGATTAVVCAPWPLWLAARGELTAAREHTARWVVHGDEDPLPRPQVWTWNVAHALTPLPLVRRRLAADPAAPTADAWFRGGAVGLIPYAWLLGLGLAWASRSARDPRARARLVGLALTAALIAAELAQPLPTAPPDFQVITSPPGVLQLLLATAGLTWVGVLAWRHPGVGCLLRVSAGATLLALCAIRAANWGWQLVNTGVSLTLVVVLIALVAGALPPAWRPYAWGAAFGEWLLGTAYPLLRVATDGYNVGLPATLDDRELLATVTVLRDALPVWGWAPLTLLGAAGLGLAAWSLWEPSATPSAPRRRPSSGRAAAA